MPQQGAFLSRGKIILDKFSSKRCLSVLPTNLSLCSDKFRSPPTHTKKLAPIAFGLHFEDTAKVQMQLNSERIYLHTDVHSCIWKRMYSLYVSYILHRQLYGVVHGNRAKWAMCSLTWASLHIVFRSNLRSPSSHTKYL